MCSKNDDRVFTVSKGHRIVLYRVMDASSINEDLSIHIDPKVIDGFKIEGGTGL
jgi:hypothetical protein